MSHYHDLIADLRQPTRELRDAIPDVWNGFAQLHKAAVADGVLSSKIKELMAFAIAVHDECTPGRPPTPVPASKKRRRHWVWHF